ncbi:MAG TPA: hypothetical protein VJB14_01725, partial [Planctomycetota bacterium]|nr:hypothetical protein [Planctomycetota bacterium]
GEPVAPPGARPLPRRGRDPAPGRRPPGEDQPRGAGQPDEGRTPDAPRRERSRPARSGADP